MSFFEELKRRNVVRVGIAYAVAAWIILQLTDVVGEILELPPWGGKLILLMVAVGFFLSLFLAWAFELTPDGIKRESEVDREESIAPRTGRKLDRAIIGLLVVALGYFIWESRFKAPGEPLTMPDAGNAVSVTDPVPADSADSIDEASVDTGKSIVVLPFVNMSADPDQEFFSDGLSEEILNALVPIEDLRVISRTSAFAFKGKDLSIPQIAEQLGVTHVLEGSVRSRGQDLRITAQLIEVATDSHLWSQAYNRKMENVFEVQEEISLAIAEQLELQLSDRTATEAQTDNIDAYTLYLRGRHHYQVRGPEDMTLAEDLLTQAVSLDPNFDEAWATLAAARTINSYYFPERYAAFQAGAMEAADQALSINPTSGLANAVLGLLAHGRLEFEEALRLQELAIQQSPNESNAYLWKAISLASLGYIQEATATLKTAERFDPAFVNLHNWLISLYLAADDFDSARHHLMLARSIDPDAQLNDVGMLSLRSGDFDAFREDIASSGLPDESQDLMLAIGAAVEDPAKADQAIARMLANEQFLIDLSGWVFFFQLGAMEATYEAWRIQSSSVNGLLAANSLYGIWSPGNRDKLESPEMLRIFKQTGLFDYWKTHGNPDYCRVAGDRLECNAP